MALRESYVERRQIKGYVKSLGGLCIKLPVGGGFPDRLIILKKGRILFLEVKRPGKKPTALQYHWIKKLREYGLNADWADSLDRAKEIIDDI